MIAGWRTLLAGPEQAVHDGQHGEGSAVAVPANALGVWAEVAHVHGGPSSSRENGRVTGADPTHGRLGSFYALQRLPSTLENLIEGNDATMVPYW